MTSNLPGYTPKVYENIRDLLANGLATPPAPEIMRCSDGVGLFYSAAVNSVFGDPESGKTWIVLVAMTEQLLAGQSVLFIDLDHNGAAAIVSRLHALGVPTDTLSDASLFRYSEPEDAVDIRTLIQDATYWQPTLVAIDSLGELLPVYGASSNSADDYTRVHKAAIKPFAQIGSCVIVVDHEAKNAASREYGAGGTMAKKRAIDGAYLRCRVVDAFAPGRGGRAELTITKDRHGGLRAARDGSDKEPLAAKFELSVPGAFPDNLSWKLIAPAPGERAEANQRANDDRLGQLVKQIEALDPPATSGSDAARRIQGRRQDIFEAYRLISSGNVPGTTERPVPSSQPPCREPERLVKPAYVETVEMADESR
ncbi:AAA family ATPase [Gulosibacter bifidus]|uniref:AAA family ATPase n=1 Tax=Gulosibacter bifidus TaxID=272239 RepID=A0ABW5RJ79_9MICO|nr:AAA family ATPase [Gulosibacter bifidus]